MCVITAFLGLALLSIFVAVLYLLDKEQRGTNGTGPGGVLCKYKNPNMLGGPGA